MGYHGHTECRRGGTPVSLLGHQGLGRLACWLGALGGTLGSRVTRGGWSGDNVLLWGNGAMREKSSRLRR